MKKPLFLSALSIVLILFSVSCDKHQWEDHPEKGKGSKHLFKAHGDNESHHSGDKTEK
jgi:hypothetical protein